MMYKYPHFLLIALSSLILSRSLLLAESNSSLKSETTVADADSTKEELTKEEPEIVLPTRKKIRNTITLKGFIEDPDALPISIDTQNWSDLRISVPPVHGKELKKGEVLMELDMEKIRTHIQFLSHDLNILDLNKEILQAEIKLAEELAPLEKAEIDRFENYVKEDFLSLIHI